nr:type II secretion system protein GspL [uncultured Pantoea sp.]
MNRQKRWLVFKWEPGLPLGVRWHYQITPDEFVQGDTAENLPPASEVQVVVILPGQDITLHSITLASRKHEALMWQLEPLLLSEMPQMFSVVLERQGTQHLMAVIARERLQACIDHIRALGYEPCRAVAPALLLDAGTNRADGEEVHVRLASGEGITLHRTQWAVLCEVKPQLLDTESQPESSLARFAAAAIASRYTLLQREFRPARPRMRSWRPTLFAAALFSLALLAEPLWAGWQYQQLTRELTALLHARYQPYFPEAQTALPKKSLRLKLAALRNRSASASLPELLSLSSPLLNALQTQRWQKMQWDSERQQLRIEYARPVDDSMLKSVPAGIEARANQQHLIVSKTS